MSVQQLNHSEIENERRVFPVSVVCDNINSAENVGMVFRISEAMGVEHLYLCGSTTAPPNKKLLRTSRSTEKYVPYTISESCSTVLEDLKNKGYTIVSLEITNESAELCKTNFNGMEKLALIIGNEKHGVEKDILSESDLCVEIKMFGNNTSVNVVNSLSIALYEITKQMT